MNWLCIFLCAKTRHLIRHWVSLNEAQMGVIQLLLPAGSQRHVWQIHLKGYFAICVCANLALRGLGRSVFGQRTVVTGRWSCRVGRGWESPLGSSRPISPALNSGVGGVRE